MYATKTLNFAPPTPTPCFMHLCTFKYPLSPCVCADFQYWILLIAYCFLFVVSSSLSWKDSLDRGIFPHYSSIIFFFQIKKVRLREGSTYLLQWNVFTSTFNRFFYKIEIKSKIKGCMWCQLFYSIPVAILCSKFNYSDVTSVKHPLPESFSFFFLSRKSSKMENVKLKCILTYRVWLSPVFPCMHSYHFVMTVPSPHLHMYFMDGPLRFELKQNIFLLNKFEIATCYNTDEW